MANITCTLKRICSLKLLHTAFYIFMISNSSIVLLKLSVYQVCIVYNTYFARSFVYCFPSATERYCDVRISHRNLRFVCSSFIFVTFLIYTCWRCVVKYADNSHFVWWCGNPKWPCKLKLCKTNLIISG